MRTNDFPRADRSIVFLEDLRTSPSTAEDRRVSRWATRDVLTANYTAAFEREVRAEIARQSPEAMIAGADRIVLAHPRSSGWTDPQRWTVDRTLRGERSAFVMVQAVTPELSLPEGRSLLFLRKAGSVYEPVRLGAGFVAVRGSHVPAWNCSLEQAIAKITRAVR